MWGERMNNMVDLSWKQHYLLTRAIKKIDSSNAQRLLLHILAKRNEKEKRRSINPDVFLLGEGYDLIFCRKARKIPFSRTPRYLPIKLCTP